MLIESLEPLNLIIGKVLELIFTISKFLILSLMFIDLASYFFLNRFFEERNKNG